MTYGNSVTKSCPQCGIQIHLPDQFSSGPNRYPAHRGCSCTVDRTQSNGPQGDLSDLYRRMNKLEDWMDIMLHLIPNSMPSQPMFSGTDLNGMRHNPNPPMPHPHMVEAVKQNDYLIKQYRSELPKSNLYFRMCLYCGALSFSRSETANGFGDPGILFDEYQTCFDCISMRDENPKVFTWVTKILLLAYRSVNMIEPTPEPLVTRKRNIMVDNANPER